MRPRNGAQGANGGTPRLVQAVGGRCSALSGGAHDALALLGTHAATQDEPAVVDHDG